LQLIIKYDHFHYNLTSTCWRPNNHFSFFFFFEDGAQIMAPKWSRPNGGAQMTVTQVLYAIHNQKNRSIKILFILFLFYSSLETNVSYLPFGT